MAKPAPLAEQVCGGHPTFFVADLAVTGPAVVAHHGNRADQVEAGRFGWDADHRGARVGVGLGIGDDHRDRQLSTDRAGCEPLVAVDHPLLPVAHRARLQEGWIRARHLWLGHRKAGANPALQQALQPGCSLLLAAMLGEDLHVAGIGCGAVEGHRRGRRAATHLLTEQPVLPVLEPGSVALVGHEEVPKPLRAGPLADLDQDPWVGDPGSDLGVKRGHDLALLRVDPLRHEVQDALAQGLYLGAWGEVHIASSPRGSGAGNASSVATIASE